MPGKGFVCGSKTERYSVFVEQIPHTNSVQIEERISVYPFSAHDQVSRIVHEN
jgi:hypothetical protein